MPEHSPAAVLVRECPACMAEPSQVSVDSRPDSPRHSRALLDAYLAERARVAEVVAAMDALVDSQYDSSNWRAWGVPQSIERALAPFRSES